MIYVIFGVPGVGKSAVIHKVVENTDIEWVNWGDMTADILVKTDKVGSRDDMRKLSLEDQRPAQEEVAERIVKMSGDLKKEGKDLLIETHAAIKTPQGYWPGLNFDVFQKIRPDIFITLEASAENIFSRRKNDKTRDRTDDLTLESVKEHIRISREMAAVYAVLTAGTAFFVENKEGDVDYAVGKIVGLMGRE